MHWKLVCNSLFWFCSFFNFWNFTVYVIMPFENWIILKKMHHLGVKFFHNKIALILKISSSISMIRIMNFIKCLATLNEIYIVMFAESFPQKQVLNLWHLQVGQDIFFMKNLPKHKACTPYWSKFLSNKEKLEYW